MTGKNGFNKAKKSQAKIDLYKRVEKQEKKKKKS